MPDRSVRAALAEQFEKAEAEIEEAPEAVEEEEAPADEAPAEEEAAEETVEAAEEEEKPAPKEGRDEKGRFVPAEAKPETKAKPAAKVEPAAPAAVDKGATLEAPASWTPGEREAWRKTPPHVRETLHAAIHRAERERVQVAQQFQQARQAATQINQQLQQEQGFRQQVNGFVQPFAGIFAAEGVDPMQGVANVVQTYGALHFGSREQKASIIAGLLQRFSNTDDVNAVMSGQIQAQQVPAFRAPPPQQRQQQPQDVGAIVKQQLAEQLQAAQTARHERDLAAFAATKPEFLNDVWDEMAAIVARYEDAGRNITWEQAYAKACQMNDGVSSILKNRADSDAVLSGAAAKPAATARRAAATVRSKPGGGVSSAPAATDLRGQLEKNWDAVS